MPYFSLSRAWIRCAYVPSCVRVKEKSIPYVSSELFLPLVPLSCAQIRHSLCDRRGSVYGPSEAAGTSVAKKGGDGGRLRGNEGCWTNVFRSLSAWLLSFPPPSESSAFFPLLAVGMGRDRQSSLQTVKQKRPDSCFSQAKRFSLAVPPPYLLQRCSKGELKCIFSLSAIGAEGGKACCTKRRC